MNQSTDTASKRPVILYIIIAVALCGALLLGVWWAKNRAGYYGQVPPQAQPAPEEIVAEANDPLPVQTETTPTPAPAPTAEVPSSVPAAGAEQNLLSIGVLSALIFAIFSYIRARRRLMTYKTFTF